MKSIILIAVLLFVFLAGVLLFKPNAQTPATLPSTPAPKTSITVGTKNIPVEVADTPQSKTLGLGERDNLSQEEGMLFVFGQPPVPVNFWMKGMRFALDIIFIADNKVTQIMENLPPEPGVADINLKAYIPNEPVNYVLEVNAGFVKKNNIKVGDSFAIN